jgi:hypothetical protein
MSFNALEEILVKDWEKATDSRAERLSRLSGQVRRLSPNERSIIVGMYRECVPNPFSIDPKTRRELQDRESPGDIETEIEGIQILALSEFLHTLMLSEYRIDDLLFHPRNLRFSRLERFAESVGLSLNDLKQIYLHWHNELRGRVLSTIDV